MNAPATTAKHRAVAVLQTAEASFKSYWAVIIKQWKLILGCFLLVGLGTYLISKIIPPTYASTAIIQITIQSNKGPSDINNLLASDQLVQTEARLAISDNVLRVVAASFPGMTLEHLQKVVTTTPITNTQLFEITAEDPNPNTAAQIANDVAAALIAQQQQVQADSGDFLRVAQDAIPSKLPVRPNVLLNTGAGALAGLFLGVLLALFYTQLDQRVREATELTRLTDQSILATIWQSRTDKFPQIVNPVAKDPNIEAYRILRTNIGFSNIAQPVRTMLITSPQPQDGKSVVAANLAIYLAKAGKSTLVIDADLRCPTQHEKFGLPAHSKGMSNALLAYSEATAPDAVKLESYLQPSGIPNLQIMTSGPLPPNPPELLDSKAMERLLEGLSKLDVDMIILDAPPLIGLSDSSILAAKVDGALMVVDIQRVTRPQVEKVMNLLALTGTRILGFVTNKQTYKKEDTLDYSYYTEDHTAKRGRARHAHAAVSIPVNAPTAESQESR